MTYEEFFEKIYSEDINDLAFVMVKVKDADTKATFEVKDVWVETSEDTGYETVWIEVGE